MNINTADEATLLKLPGVDAAIAKAIVAGRPWKSINDLAKITGHAPQTARIVAVPGDDRP